MDLLKGKPGEGWRLEDMPAPTELSTDARAVVIALLAIQCELDLTNRMAQPAFELNSFNLEQVKKLTGGGIVPAMGGLPGPRRA